MKARDRPERHGVFGDRNPTPNSLFGEILDWMLAPLLLVWPISIAATHHVADDIANQPYDVVLAETVSGIVRALQITPEGVVVTLPKAPNSVTGTDEGDQQFYQVAIAGGEVLAGDPDVPGLPVGERQAPGEMRFRNADLQGERIRIAYQLVPSLSDARPLLVQVAETRRQRTAHSSRIISGVLLPHFAIIPLAVILVWLGLTRGLFPLARLQNRIRNRRTDDLSPIDLRTVPEELHPVIAAFNDMMERLQGNLDAQQRFIAAAAHQLKTPLTGLKTQVELARGESDCEQLQAYLSRIAEGVDRAERVTYQLLQLARAEASHEKPQPMTHLDLAGVARDTTASCVPRALERGIDLGFESVNEAVPFMATLVLVREMLDNLVDNAIKYTPRNGHVTVRVRLDPHPVFEVEDSGIGIASEDRTRVFDRFYRALGTDAEGSGLGLAIVREIADLHQARVDILDASGGKGTLVRVSFPPAHAIAMASGHPTELRIAAPH